MLPTDRANVVEPTPLQPAAVADIPRRDDHGLRPRILVASDALPPADRALAMGVALARRDFGEVEILSVLEPLERLPAGGIANRGRVSPEVRSGARRREIADQIDRAGVGEGTWSASLAFGRAADCITRHAAQGDCDLIVVGGHDHRLIDQIWQRETALRIAQATRIPVLAARDTSVPTCIAVGVDLSPSSLNTARAAARLLSDEGTLYLVHVAGRVAVPLADSREFYAGYGNELRGRFASLVRDLIVPPGIRVECITLYGDPATELVDFAERASCDVIATGARRRRSLSAMLGPVTSRVFRTSPVSVLLVPSR